MCTQNSIYKSGRRVPHWPLRQPAAKPPSQPQPRIYLAADARDQIPQLLLQKLGHCARTQPKAARGSVELE